MDRCDGLPSRYQALRLACGYKNIRNFTKNELGKFIKAGIGPKHHTAEFRVTSDCLLPIGHELSVRHLVPGQWCYVSGFTKPKGSAEPTATSAEYGRT